MKSHEKDNWITAYLKSKPLEVTLQVIGVGILILNIWLSSKLAPLAQNLSVITERVAAVEKIAEGTSGDHVDIQIIKEQVIGIREDVAEIKRAITGN